MLIRDFAPNLLIPPPAGYILGVGDRIIIHIWGTSEFRYSRTLDKTGRIAIPGIGPLFLGGLSLSEAKAYLAGELSKIYDGLVPGAVQKTYLTITLGPLRSIAVNVLGEVRVPGTYFLSAASSLFNVLYYARGP